MKVEVIMETLEIDYQEALQKCQDGKFSEELRLLYQMPHRERVPWELFPNWAHSDECEGTVERWSS